ncbi:hypothetical protein [Pararobbsia alpina]|jgi:hypothetical protein|uniref:Lipoprotein n=1 Tax=Pararobbsia alpina TaxID=621374 RepID=A0A6S7B8W9_9BURK|nr:hypothetical protein [Pararobbsia alpina]CAB3791694.1 hypothetical protein LMG28138_03213 [Pararobbsia alpina]
MPVRLHSILALLMLAGLAACTLPEIPSFSASRFEAPELKADRAQLQGQGYSQAYIDGHVEGCGTGYKSAGNLDFSWTNDGPTLSGADYLAGWNAGFALCRGKYEDYGVNATPAAPKQ